MSHKRDLSKDLTQGTIWKLLLLYAIPLLFGNLFQQLYNTVDSVVVGRFVSKQALAAIGCTTPIINTLVLFFNGVSVGAGVVVSQYFGAGDHSKLRKAIKTSLILTSIFSVLFTLIGVLGSPFMLRLMGTPKDVAADAVLYLKIYFLGITGLLFYNLGSSILRAIGNTKYPMFSLCICSLMNIGLDLIFVLYFHMGVAGVAIATIISQCVSAGVVMFIVFLQKWSENSDEVRFDMCMMKKILTAGLPMGIQQTITSFSNIFVQAYINHFGSSCMAGWSCYLKIDSFLVLPILSMMQSVTTFAAQNSGANYQDRTRSGTRIALGMSLLITATGGTLLIVFARSITAFFNQDPEVLYFGTLFIREIVPFVPFICCFQMLSGTLRGIGHSKGPMWVMLVSFVAFRQCYLLLGTKLTNSIYFVAFSYPAAWMVCAALTTMYYLRVLRKFENKNLCRATRQSE